MNYHFMQVQTITIPQVFQIYFLKEWDIFTTDYSPTIGILNRSERPLIQREKWAMSEVHEMHFEQYLYLRYNNVGTV